MTLKDLVKTENIIKASPHDALSTALGHLTSSHDAAFIFSDAGEYLGVINPYYSIIQTSYPGKTKVQNCLFHPPRLHIDDTVNRAAQLMAESKVHYLPIFDQSEAFMGITTARRILRYILSIELKELLLGDVISDKSKNPILIAENDNLHTALELYKEFKISKLIVTDKNDRVTGILSYYDLIPYLVAPGNKQKRATNVDEREKFLQMKAKNYAKKTMLTCNTTHTVGEAIESILKHNMGSVIIVDRESHPVGLLTTRDILNLLKNPQVKKEIELTTKNLSEQYESSVHKLVKVVEKAIEKDPSMLRGRIYIQEEKKGELFKISVQLIPVKGEPVAVEKEGKDLLVLVNECKQILSKRKIEMEERKIIRTPKKEK